MSGIKSFFKEFWKIIVAISVILSVISSFLQISGYIDIIKIIKSFWLSFSSITINLPIVIFTFICYTIIIILLSSQKESILRAENARKIVAYCKQKPRTPSEIRQVYNSWQYGPFIVVGGYTYNDYIKKLEEEGMLEYKDEKWIATEKAIKIIEKYYGK